MRTFALCLMIASFACASLACAQDNNLGPSFLPTGYGVPGGHYGFVGGDGARAATAYESMCRGTAEMIRDQGQYNLLTALARINMAEAQRMEVDNRQHRVKVWLAMRDAHKERLAAELQARRQRGKVANPAVPAKKVGFIPQNLAWPEALQPSQYGGYRRLVERLAADQAAGLFISAADQRRLQEATRLVAARLNREDPPDLAAARQFVESLVSGDPNRLVQLAAN